MMNLLNSVGKQTKTTRIWETQMKVVEMALAGFLIPFVKRAEEKLQKRQGETHEVECQTK